MTKNADQEFDLMQWKNTHDKIEHQTNVSVLASTPIFALPIAFSFAALLHSGPDKLPLAGAVTLGVLLGLMFGLLCAMFTFGLVVQPLHARGLTRAKLGPAHEDLYAIAEDVDAILKLNPPAEVLAEVLAVREATNQVTSNLIRLRLLMPGEDLNESSPRKWLRNTREELARVRSELEEARFQSYVEPIPMFSLEASSRAIAEEKRFVNEVLTRSSDSTAILSEADRSKQEAS